MIFNSNIYLKWLLYTMLLTPAVIAVMSGVTAIILSLYKTVPTCWNLNEDACEEICTCEYINNLCIRKNNFINVYASYHNDNTRCEAAYWLIHVVFIILYYYVSILFITIISTVVCPAIKFIQQYMTENTNNYHIIN
jgi:hypothetical protein